MTEMPESMNASSLLPKIVDGSFDDRSIHDDVSN